MNNYLPTDYQSFIHTSRYARWLDDEQRRETWSETVERYIENVVQMERSITSWQDVQLVIRPMINPAQWVEA